MQLSDWIVIILYLVAMLGIGFFAKGKIQTMDDFILGGKRFGKVALIGTIVATMVGSGMTMGAVGTAYNNGSTSTVPWMYFGFSVGLIVMGLIAPQVRETNARSIAEIMNIKFGKPARLAMACLVTFYAVAMVAINIAGLRTVIINCFGFPADKLVLATVIAAGIAILYTSIGGMYAVVWTDVAQFAIMFLGVFVLGPILGVSQAGGISVMEETMQALGKSLTNPFACGISSSMIGMMLSYFLCSPGDPTMPQRALAAKDGKSAKFSFLVAGGIGFWMGIALILIGVAVRVIMPEIADNNAVLPMWILSYYPPVVRGFVIAGLIARLCPRLTLSSSLVRRTSCMTSVAASILSSRMRPSRSPYPIRPLHSVLSALSSRSTLPASSTSCTWCFPLWALQSARHCLLPFSSATRSLLSAQRPVSLQALSSPAVCTSRLVITSFLATPSFLR